MARKVGLTTTEVLEGAEQLALRAARAMGEALLAATAPAIRGLREAGVAADDAVHLTRAFRAALHGFITLEKAGGFGMPESVDESFSRLVALLVAGVHSRSGVQ